MNAVLAHFQGIEHVSILPTHTRTAAFTQCLFLNGSVILCCPFSFHVNQISRRKSMLFLVACVAAAALVSHLHPTQKPTPWLLLPMGGRRHPAVQLSSSWRRSPGHQRKRLAGSFTDPPVEYEDRPVPLADEEEASDEDDYDRDHPRKVEWSRRATAKQKAWANMDLREAALAKRRATFAASGRISPRPKAVPNLSPSDQRRSDALKLMREDEEQWFERRLLGGEEARRQLEPEGKAELQRRRSEQAKRGWVTRRANVASGRTVPTPERAPPNGEVIVVP